MIALSGRGQTRGGERERGRNEWLFSTFWTARIGGRRREGRYSVTLSDDLAIEPRQMFLDEGALAEQLVEMVRHRTQFRVEKQSRARPKNGKKKRSREAAF